MNEFERAVIEAAKEWRSGKCLIANECDGADLDLGVEIDLLLAFERKERTGR